MGQRAGRAIRITGGLLLVGMLGIQGCVAGNAYSAPSGVPANESTTRGTQQMNTLISNPTSLIREARHIAIIRLLEAKPLDSSPAGAGVEKVVTAASFEVEAVLLGETGEHPPFTVDMEIEQHLRTITRVFAVPGVWSAVALEAEARYAVFSTSESADPREFIAESGTLAVLPADEVVFDVHMALTAESEALSIDDLIARLTPQMTSVGPLLAEYIASRQSSLLFEDFAGFTSLLKMMEDPGLGVVPRTVLFEAVHANLADSDIAPDDYVAAMVRTSFRIFLLDEAAAMRDNLLEQDLPLLLSLEEGDVRLTADSVFKEFSGLRRAAKAGLDTYPDSDVVEDLKRWLG